MKIYTRKGDDGSTGLVTGERVPKHDARVELYGTADELNSIIGCALSELDRSKTTIVGSQNQAAWNELRADLTEQQNLLFELGSELAGFVVQAGRSTILPEDIENLEDCMDRYTADLPELTSFVLPGGSAAAAQLHVARTVCRRLERAITARIAQHAAGASQNPASDSTASVAPVLLRYVNRLSDYLFVAARFANRLSSIEDVAWVSRGKQQRKRLKNEPRP